jgi:hypothetical protein
MTGRFPFRNGWNTYGNVNQCGKRCGGTCCPGQRGYAEELSAVPLAFEIMPKMLKRAGCKKMPPVSCRSSLHSKLVCVCVCVCVCVFVLLCATTARNRRHTHARQMA